MNRIQIPMGVYVPGTSLLHRASPGVKLLVVLLFIAVTAALGRTYVTAGGAVAVVLVGYVVARIPVRVAWSQFWPPLPIILALGAFQWWQRGLQPAVATTIVLLCSIMAASLLTLTTTIGELLESIDRALAPLERFGVPATTISLALALTIRLIPLQLATVVDVLQARKARGAGFSIAAFGTPVLVRSMRRANAIAEALAARGVADD